MTSRRGFLAGLIATGFSPALTWADAGGPTFLTAAKKPDGTFILCGVDEALAIIFEVPLPGRGHAATAHPVRPEAVAFARRPGRFAIVVNCVTGQADAILDAPTGRHFYGHGAFSMDGRWLFTSENDFDAAKGVIGVWDASDGYRRVGEMPSGGVGPHEIKRLPGEDILVVANGGIETHPDAGRSKLNIPTMAPNLTYLKDREIIEQIELGPEFQKNSIRHLATSSAGDVAFGMQWEGAGEAPPLVAVHRIGRGTDIVEMPADDHRKMSGYVGSIAFSQDGQRIAATSPRGGVVQVIDAAERALLFSVELEDVGGVSGLLSDFAVTSGTGVISAVAKAQRSQHNLSFDNHLIAVSDA